MADLKQFQNFMTKGDDAAWQRNWAGAIEAYSQAVQHKPDDADAHINLGLALLNAKQLDRALKVFQRASQLAPTDPVPLERCAEVLEILNQPKEASDQFIKVAEIYLSMRDISKAITNWERATSLVEGLLSIHARLAQAYEKLGDKAQTIRQYILLAYYFDKQKDPEKATRSLERVIRIDKNNPLALNGMRALKGGGHINLPPEFLQGKARQTKEVLAAESDLFSLDFDNDTVAEANPLGPIGETLDLALEMLAAYVIESGLNDYVMLALQGMESQRQGLGAEAIKAYQQAVQAGLRHPSMQMCLGGLLVQNEKFKESLTFLGEAARVPNLAAGAFHGIGKAYFQLGEHKKASRYLIQSLQAVDTDLAANVEEIEELSQVYESLLGALEGRNPDDLKTINERFISLLTGKDWKVRIKDTRRHLAETLQDEGEQGIVDFLAAGGSDDLADLVSQIDRFIRQGLYTLAMDESHRAVERAPFYLPVHVRMAEIMMKEGRIRQAINKFNTVAMAYLVREENKQAASILESVVKMAPLDINIRLNLIELLEGEKRLPEALDHYVQLAETYQQLGDFDKASQTFIKAEEIAKQQGASPESRAQIKHYLADINQMRLNTRGAQKIYEEILEFAHEDEKALRALIEIYYTQGNQVEAVKRLDVLLGAFAQTGKVQQITRLLEELVHANPSDTALRKRLASIYRKRGQKQEAIEQLDALGELQLDAGLNQEAAQTIKQIISMSPDRLDDYKRLLQQLGG